ncbi:MAG: hypothetical protein U0Y68_07275 [Blastocatellia bacterium]
MYKGKFDKGWDKVREETLARQKQMGIVPQNTTLPARNADIKAWDELTTDQRRLFARLQEVFAGMLTHTDEHIGRLVNFLEDSERSTTQFLLSCRTTARVRRPLDRLVQLRALL